MSSDSTAATDFCYRHPDRQSYILCQRCGRTICPSCQTQASVGVHCPECVREARQNAPRTKPRVVSAFSRTSNKPVVTYSIIAITLVTFLLQLVPGSPVRMYLTYYPTLTAVMPWGVLTYMLVHASVLHILFNMYSLWIFGPILESLIGRARFLVLYLVAGFGGAVAVLYLSASTGVVGASGAIFGLMGAFFVIQRRLGGNNVQILIVIGLNVLLGFVIPNISWQAHIGGLVAGAAIAFIFLQTRAPRQRNPQIVLVSAIVLALVAATVLRVAAF